jgi:hypothetical protein
MNAKRTAATIALSAALFAGTAIPAQASQPMPRPRITVAAVTGAQPAALEAGYKWNDRAAALATRPGPPRNLSAWDRIVKAWSLFSLFPRR